MPPDHLLQIATDLAEINVRRPRRADLDGTWMVPRGRLSRRFG